MRYVGAALKQTNYEQITIIGRQLSGWPTWARCCFCSSWRGGCTAISSRAAAVLGRSGFADSASALFRGECVRQLFVVTAFFFIMRAASEGDGRTPNGSVGMAVSSRPTCGR
jgi:hypothetical protein